MMGAGFLGALVIFLIVFFIWLLWPMTIGAQWVPTSMKVVRKMLELADVQAHDVLIDLGSGDGRIILTAANEYQAKAIGIEVDPIRLLWSRSTIKRKGLSERVKVIRGNFFHKDLSKATVVTVYQNQDTNQKLISKFEKELKPGTRVVSHGFTFDGWEPKTVDKEAQLYLYIV
jgi:cyclopropane fatty-acyl-phospholipid synthase-like methyltransferase